MRTPRLLDLVLAALLTSGSVVSAQTFHVSPTLSPSGDVSWQAAVGRFTELDLEAVPPGSVDTLAAGGVTVDVDLDGVGGNSETVELWTLAGPGLVCGEVEGQTLLSRADPGDVWHSQITFTFSAPVRGFGSWIFDDAACCAQSFRLVVTDANSVVHFSPLLERGNGTATEIEGFLGVVSEVGIAKVAVESLDEGTGTPFAQAFELDHVQIGAVVADAGPSGIYQWDSGSASVIDPDFGKTGEQLRLQRFTTRRTTELVTEIRAAFFDTGGAVVVGAPVRYGVWDDPDDDGDPSNAILLTSPLPAGVVQVVGNGLNVYPVDPPVAVSGEYYVGVVLETIPADGISLADAGCTTTEGRSFFAHAGGGALDLTDLGHPSNGLGEQDSWTGLPGVWRIRATSSALDCGAIDAGASLTVGAAPRRSAAADLDGDGILDVVVANSGSSNLTILLGDGAGGFTPGPSLSVTGAPRAVAIADLDGDGLQDVLATMANATACTGATAQVFLNDGIGGYTGLTPIAGLGPVPVGIALVDLNGDGALDACLANRRANDGTCRDESLTVLFGDGLGGFSAPQNLPLGTRPTAIVAEDWNEDGNPDVGYTDGTTGYFHVLLGDGAGGLTPFSSAFCGVNPRDVVRGDWNRDGFVDAAVALGTSDLVAILTNDGTGTFTVATLSVSTEPVALAVIDLDMAGTPDLLVVTESSGDVVVLEGLGDGTFSSCPALPLGATPLAISAVDLDDDGDRDPAIVLGGIPGSLVAYENVVGPAGTFAEVLFPAGVASFADQVLGYDPSHGAGAVPVPPFDDPDAALAEPDAVGATGARTTSLGSGGRLELLFVDNRLGNSGDTAPDLAIFEAGAPTETLSIALRAGSASTSELLTDLGETLDPDGFVDLGSVSPGDITIDLDARFPGLPAGRLHFDAVRLDDDPTKDGTSGPSVGPDIDAVGAVASFQPVPDLEIGAFVTPLEGLAGFSYNLAFQVRNVGDADAVQPWTDRLWLSDDDVLDGGDTELGALVAPQTLSPGESFMRVATFQLPLPGTYWFFAVTDSDGDVDEGSFENNNERRSAQPVVVEPAPRPDLVVELLSYPTSNITSGGAVTLQYRVTNQGDADTTATKWFEGFYLAPQNSDLTGALSIGAAPNQTFLAPGDYYDGQALFFLPSDFSGDFYFAAWTDHTEAMDENSEGNNLTFSAATVTVALEDQPDLVPMGVDPQFDSGFSGKYITVYWEDQNQGNGVTDTADWVDLVYLSENNNSSIDPGDELLGVLSPGVLLFGGETTGVLELDCLLPVDADGDYYLKVSTDATDVVSELGFEGNNVGVSMDPITVALSPTPDLDPTAVGIGGGGTSAAIGLPAKVTWSVQDTGFAGWEDPFNWKDAVYLSTDASLEVGTDLLLGAFAQGATFDGVDWIGTNYTKTRTVLIPESVVPGTYYLIVQVDRANSVFEFDTDGGGDEGEDNNVEASSPVTLDLVPTDLVPTAGSSATDPPRAGAAGQDIQIAWTVTNQGTADTTAASWIDRVYLSLDGLPSADDTVVAARKRKGTLAPGQFYEVEATVEVPFVAPGAYELLYVADELDHEFEPGAETNNVAASSFTVTDDAADLVVAAVIAPDSVVAGETVVVDWTVLNQGVLETNRQSWYDDVHLSADETLDSGDIYLGSAAHEAALGAGSSRQLTGAFTVPIELSGLWYVLVSTDSTARVFEADETNNTASDRMQIDVDEALAANLVVTNVLAPGTGNSGQSITVTWDVENAGQGATNVGDWADTVFISQDQVFDPLTDRYLGYYQHPDFLDVGETRSVSHSVEIPSGVTGKHFVFVRTNQNGAVYEAGAVEDNIAFAATLTDITLPPPSNLRITDITVDSAAEVGDGLTVEWTTLNEGPSAVSGAWQDSFYLSADGSLDGSDHYLGQFPSTVSSLAVGESKTSSRTIPIPGILPATLTLLASADSQNQINEVIEEDNVAGAPSPTSVTIPQLGTNDQDTRELNKIVPRYWELLAPTPNETIRITLSHSQPDAWTELYVREGAIPSEGNFDYGFEDPGSSTQEIVIPSTSGNPYYILARATAYVGPGQPATIATEVVPFELTAVAPQVAGAGVVTFELEGSQLDDLVELKLRSVGDGSEFLAFELATIDAAEALAAVDLSAAPFGMYDVIVESNIGEVSEILGSVEVEAVESLKLGAKLSISPSIRKGGQGSATLVVANKGNVNVPRGLIALGTGANLGATDSAEEVVISAPTLEPAALERGDLGDTVALFVEDLGPSQQVSLALDVDVGADFAPESFALALSGVPRAETVFSTQFLRHVIETLRLEVLADQSAGTELLALAAKKYPWRNKVLAGLPPDLSALHLPETLPVTGRAIVEEMAAAAAEGFPLGNEVPADVLDLVAPTVTCAVFHGKSFDCSELGASSCDDDGSEGGVILSEAGPPPVAGACAVTPVSDDPNEKRGPVGPGPNNDHSSEEEFSYRIYFENQADASAPAASVVLTDELEATFDLATFRVGDIQIGDLTIEVPEGRISYQEQLDLTDELGLLLNVTVGVDSATRIARWELQALDPDTKEPPLSGDVGFLPPNNDDGDGEGHVDFTIFAKDLGALASTKTAKNDAHIQFDSNPPLETNTYENRLDTEDPTSSMSGALGESSRIDLSWSGSDSADGSGVRDYSIWVSVDGGPYDVLFSELTGSTASFQAEPDRTYSFYSLATDYAGREEDPPATPDVVIVTPPSRPRAPVIK